MANRIVECAEFCSLLAGVDERYPVPEHVTIMREMDKLLIDLKGHLMSCLNDTKKVALCVNIWSRKGLTASYLGITAHFYTRSDHKRLTATIAVRRLPHTAEVASGKRNRLSDKSLVGQVLKKNKCYL